MRFSDKAKFKLLREACKLSEREKWKKWGLEDKIIERIVDGFVSAYPYYGNDFAKKIVRKIGENMACVFRNKLADSREETARGIFNLIVIYADKLRETREKLGHGLFTIVINPTNVCNRKCKECYIGSSQVGMDGRFPRREMSVDDMSGIIEQMKNYYGTNFVTWSGGEPCLRLDKIISVLKKHDDIASLMFTNNDFLNSETIEKIAETGNLFIGNSFEGSREYTDRIRGENAYDKAMKAMQLETEKGIFFGPSITPTNENIDEITNEEFAKFLIKQGAGFIYYFANMPISINVDKCFNYLLSPAQRLKLNEFKSSRILEGDRILYMDFWNDGALVQGCMAGGQNYVNFSPPHMTKEKINEHVKKFGYSEKNVVTAILPCVFLQGIAGFVMSDGSVIAKKEKYVNIPYFIENDESMKSVREGFQKQIRERMKNGEHWLGSAPCMFYDWPEEGLSRFADNFIAFQPTFRIHEFQYLKKMKKLSDMWKSHIIREYPNMIERLNEKYSLGLESYIEEQRGVARKLAV